MIPDAPLRPPKRGDESRRPGLEGAADDLDAPTRQEQRGRGRQPEQSRDDQQLQSTDSMTGIAVVITGTDADRRVPSSRRASANCRSDGRPGIIGP